MLATLYVIHIANNTEPFVTFTTEEEAVDFVDCLRDDDGIPAFITEVLVSYDEFGVLDVDVF